MEMRRVLRVPKLDISGFAEVVRLGNRGIRLPGRGLLDVVAIVVDLCGVLVDSL